MRRLPRGRSLESPSGSAFSQGICGLAGSGASCFTPWWPANDVGGLVEFLVATRGHQCLLLEHPTTFTTSLLLCLTTSPLHYACGLRIQCTLPASILSASSTSQFFGYRAAGSVVTVVALFLFSCSACSDHSRFFLAITAVVEFRSQWMTSSHYLLAWHCITVLVSLYGRDLVDPAGLFSSVMLRVPQATQARSQPTRGLIHSAEPLFASVLAGHLYGSRRRRA